MQYKYTRPSEMLGAEQTKKAKFSHSHYTIPIENSGGDDQRTLKLPNPNQGKGCEFFGGGAIELSPEHHPHPDWPWNLEPDDWLGIFAEIEARRAIKGLGNAQRYPDHGAAMSAIDAEWASITGQRVRGVA